MLGATATREPPAARLRLPVPVVDGLAGAAALEAAAGVGGEALATGAALLALVAAGLLATAALGAAFAVVFAAGFAAALAAGLVLLAVAWVAGFTDLAAVLAAGLAAFAALATGLLAGLAVVFAIGAAGFTGLAAALLAGLAGDFTGDRTVLAAAVFAAAFTAVAAGLAAGALGLLAAAVCLVPLVFAVVLAFTVSFFATCCLQVLPGCAQNQATLYPVCVTPFGQCREAADITGKTPVFCKKITVTPDASHAARCPGACGEQAWRGLKSTGLSPAPKCRAAGRCR